MGAYGGHSCSGGVAGGRLHADDARFSEVAQMERRGKGSLGGTVGVPAGYPVRRIMPGNRRLAGSVWIPVVDG
jgi:hypothetical protein